MYKFKENGFLEDDDSERCILKYPKNNLIIEYYKELFSNITNTNNYLYLEINEEKYSIIPQVIERLASKIIMIYKITGVIPYLEEEEAM